MKYTIDGIAHSYKPDFYMCEMDMIYEIKPLKRTKEKINILKMSKLQEKFGRDNCEFMTEKEIMFFINTVDIKFILDIIKKEELKMTIKQEKRLVNNLKRIKYDNTRGF